MMEIIQVILLSVVGVGALAIAGLLWLRRTKTLQLYHTAVIIMFSGFLAVTRLFYLLHDNAWVMAVLLQLQIVFVILVVFAWSGSILTTDKQKKEIQRRMMGWVSFLFLCLAGFVLTNKSHGLLWDQVGTVTGEITSELALHFRAGFWAVAAILLLSVGAVTVMAVHLLHSNRDYLGRRRGIFFLGMILPWGTLLFDFVLKNGFTFSPIIFALSALGMGVGTLRYYGEGLLPIAHRIIIQGMEDGVLVVNAAGRVVEVNDNAEKILDCSRRDAYGQLLSKLMEDILSPGEMVEMDRSWLPQEGELETVVDGQRLVLDLRSSVLRDVQGEMTGHVLVMRDITERKKMEEALRESEESYRNLFERVPVGLYRSTPNSEILDVNQALVDILGFADREALLQTKSGEHYADPGDYEAWVQQMETRGVLRDHELHLRRLDGADLWLRENAIAVRDDHGNIKHYEGSVEDITGTKLTMLALEQERNFTETVLDTVGALVVVLDKKGRIVRFNRACERLTGFLHEDLANLDLFTALIPEDEKDEVRKVFDTLLQGASVRHHENHWKTKDGEERLVSWTNAIIHGEDGNAEYIISAGIDVTDQRKAEQGLEVYANELERSNEELENFAYIASHDLQEPLRMIASYLQLLQRRYGDRLDGDADDFINYAVEGAKRMQSLIHGLLEYSRVGTSGGEFVPTDVGHVIDESLRNLTVLIEETGGEIHVEQMPTVLADETQLVQLFQNIIGNALKFHNAKPPRIQISAKRNQGAWIFTIADNGIGIPEKFHQRIFKVFQRLHTQQEYPGTGIGLAVCKRIVDRHGGAIWVESTPGEGAQFFFTLPEGHSDDNLTRSIHDRYESD